jgi:hypothetical protein
MVLITLPYLAFRDLQASLLWDFGLVHYFRLALILSAAYCVVLLYAVVVWRTWKALTLAVACWVLLMCWRVTLEPSQPMDDPQAIATNPAATGAPVFDLPAGFASWRDVYLIDASKKNIRFHRNELSQLFVGGQPVRLIFDYYIEERGRGKLLVPLRNLPAGPARLELGSGYRFHGTEPVHLKRGLRLSLPCWLSEAPCEIGEFVAPLPLARSGTLTFSNADESYFGDGWSLAEEWGRAMTAPTASINFRVDRPFTDAGYELKIKVKEGAPAGDPPMTVRVAANGRLLGEWSVGPEGAEFTARLPESAVDADGSVKLSFETARDAPKLQVEELQLR